MHLISGIAVWLHIFLDRHLYCFNSMTNLEVVGSRVAAWTTPQARKQIKKHI